MCVCISRYKHKFARTENGASRQRSKLFGGKSEYGFFSLAKTRTNGEKTHVYVQAFLFDDPRPGGISLSIFNGFGVVKYGITRGHETEHRL